MKRSTLLAIATLAVSGALGAACAAGGAGSGGRPTGAGDTGPVAAELARGGRLYDSWYGETRADAPGARHPAYPADGPVAAKAAATWRCKECHGWDYRGRDGVYASGSHATGIPGIRAADGAPLERVLAVLRDDTHAPADRIPDADLRRLAQFVAAGQVDMAAYVDRATGAARGDAARGSGYYATLCAGCHGADGRATDMPVFGHVSRDNPWETLHKILNGQPDTAMPALRALDRHVAVDVLAHLQTLPGR